MVAIKEFIVEWTAQNTPGGLSVLYAGGGAGSEAITRAEIAAMLTSVMGICTVETSYIVRNEGRIIEDSTGTLVGSWADTNNLTGQGTAAVPPVANAAQALMRFQTAQVVDGRLLKGRLYVPGIAAEFTGGGQLTGNAQALLATAADDYSVNSGGVVWSRPRPAGTGVGGSLPARAGSSADIISGSSWAELAVLRNRR